MTPNTKLNGKNVLFEEILFQVRANSMFTEFFHQEFPTTVFFKNIQCLFFNISQMSSGDAEVFKRNCKLTTDRSQVAQAFDLRLYI